MSRISRLHGRGRDASNALKYANLALERLREVENHSLSMEASLLASVGYAEHLSGRNDLAEFSQTELSQSDRGSRPDNIGCGDLMICVFVTFRFGDDFNEAKLQGIAEKARSKFEGLPGLRSKVFTIAAQLREARNVHLWENAEAARAFFTPEMRSRIAELYGVAPVVEYGDVATVVDNGTRSELNRAWRQETLRTYIGLDSRQECH